MDNLMTLENGVDWAETRWLGCIVTWAEDLSGLEDWLDMGGEG